MCGLPDKLMVLGVRNLGRKVPHEFPCWNKASTPPPPPALVRIDFRSGKNPPSLPSLSSSLPVSVLRSLLVLLSSFFSLSLSLSHALSLSLALLFPSVLPDQRGARYRVCERCETWSVEVGENSQSLSLSLCLTPSRTLSLSVSLVLFCFFFFFAAKRPPVREGPGHLSLSLSLFLSWGHGAEAPDVIARPCIGAAPVKTSSGRRARSGFFPPPPAKKNS